MRRYVSQPHLTMALFVIALPIAVKLFLTLIFHLLPKHSVGYISISPMSSQFLNIRTEVRRYTYCHDTLLRPLAILLLIGLDLQG